MKTKPWSSRTSLGVALALAELFVWHVSSARAQRKDAAGTKNNKWDYGELKKVPAKAEARRNPFENDTEAVVAGEKLFEQHCAECHGMNAGGADKGPSLLNAEVQQATPGAIFWILTNGVVRRGMPDWSKLPEPERWQIITFLKSFRASETKASPPGSD